MYEYIKGWNQKLLLHMSYNNMTLIDCSVYIREEATRVPLSVLCIRCVREYYDWRCIWEMPQRQIILLDLSQRGGIQHILYMKLILHNKLLTPTQHGCHFADDIFIFSLFCNDCYIGIQVSQQFLPKDPVNDKPTLIQIIARFLTGDKPSSGSMVA